MNSDKGRQSQKKIEEKLAEEETQKERELAHVRAGIVRILNGEEGAFLDQKLMDFVPSVTKQVVQNEKDQVTAAIIDRLVGGLSSDKAEVRSLVSVALFRTLDILSEEDRIATLDRSSGRLIDWIESENVLTLPYRKISLQLQALAQNFLEGHAFSKAVPIVETFSDIRKGKKVKIEAIRMLSGKILESIADENIVDGLLNELRTDDKNKRKEVFDIFVMLGEAALKPLLDKLLENQSMLERKRILRIVVEIGVAAVPSLIKRIKQGGVWYYIRNLAFLLGRVGNETHLGVLESLVQHEDVRVQQEALNSICKIGGNSRSEALLSLLPLADDRMRAKIVVLLGATRSHEAVRPLLNLLSSKSILPSKERDELEEKTCIALGRIGSQDAVPALRAIAEQKGFSGIRSFGAKVKAAAENAIAMIRKKQDQT